MTLILILILLVLLAIAFLGYQNASIMIDQSSMQTRAFAEVLNALKSNNTYVNDLRFLVSPINEVVVLVKPSIEEEIRKEQEREARQATTRGDIDD
jgi:type II secretory pathway pseudopilin PulG